MKSFLIFLICLPLWASPPDCQTSYLFANTPGSQADGVTTFTATGVTPLFPNNTGCNSWAVLVNVSGFSATSVVFQSANAGGGRSTFLGTTVSGSNPSTTTTSTVFLATGYYPYTAISVGTMTGTGSIKITIFGWLSPAYLSANVNLTAAQIVAKFSGTPDGTKFLRDDGTLAAASGALPAGSTCQSQYNAGGGLFGGTSYLTACPEVALTSTLDLGANSNNSISTWGRYGIAGTDGHTYFVDLSNTAQPTIVFDAAASGEHNWAWVFGQFLYWSNATDGTFLTYNISNIHSPVLVSTITGVTGAYWSELVGNILYVYGANLYIFDVTDRGNPALLSTFVPSGVALNAFRQTLIVRGNYAYLGGASDSFTIQIVDIHDPRNPTSAAIIKPMGSNLYSPSLALSGKWLFAGAYSGDDEATCAGSPELSCTLVVYDVSDPTAPAFVTGIAMHSGNMGDFEVDSLLIAGDRLYAGTEVITGSTCPGQCEIKVVDISNPAAPALIAGAGYDMGASTPWLSFYGKYLLALPVGSGPLTILETPGIITASVSAGRVRSETSETTGDSHTGGIGFFDTAIKAGPGGIATQGNFWGSPGGNDFRCQNYSLSNNGTNFTVNGVAGIALPAAVAASPVLFALPSRGKVVAVSSKTTTAWSGTGFVTFVSTIGDSVGGTTYYDAGAYDLAAAVSNTNFQAVGGLFKGATYAGSNVIARVTASANLNSNTITGVTDYEVCWVGLP